MTTETFRILTFCFSVQIVYSVPENHFLYEDIDKTFLMWTVSLGILMDFKWWDCIVYP